MADEQAPETPEIPDPPPAPAAPDAPAAAPPAPAAAASPDAPALGYAEVWGEAALQAIRALSGDATWSQGDASHEPEAAPPEICAHLELGGRLAGKQQIKFHRGTAHAWASLALADEQMEARRKNAPVDDAERAALEEVVKRIVAAAGPALAASGWGEVAIALRHVGPLRRTVEPGGDVVGLRFVHPRGAVLDAELGFDRVLHQRLERRLHPEAAEADEVGEEAAAAEAAAAAERAPEAAPGPGRGDDPRGSSSKLDLLLDVELDVTLRFGGRQMLLHDVLELAPGSVLELDRHIDDPVELLVGGKIVAWGDVVVVDGNYGLRVSRLVHRRERVAAMEMAR